VSNFSIRNVTASDMQDLSSLIKGFRDHLMAQSPVDSDIDLHLPRAMHDPSIEFACAWLEDRAVGFTQMRFFTSIWASGIEAYLDDVFVIPSARRQKVGRSLLRHVLARAEARHAVRVSLKTNERNESAQALYSAAGFMLTSHRLFPGGREVFWSKNIGAA